ncbi:BCCT family transporter [Lewinella sp. W8]|uniref:BCCT family transporter n=1 Tax=Lewinella sp. W8 TaxID=2528208 RepID=UPI0010688A1A|nr:BCCT family transporter [Lewinella sp. W8]MTB49636.1 BCCT family transporter [Lewinella sp. W8]
MKLRLPVILTPIIPLVCCAVLALDDPAALVARARGWSVWVLEHFDWLFNWSIFGCVVVVTVVYFSPLGRLVIGGKGAVPLLSPWRWFAVTVCTTVATGILFWGIAEPMYHLSGTPAAGADAPKVFALSTLFLHWTITPYAMYTLAGLIFAIAYYNRKQPFALSALIEPLFGRAITGYGGIGIDAICLFALVAGMSASLGTGALSLAGGTGLPPSPLTLAAIMVFIVGAFCISAASGLQRGIRILSNWNVVGFIMLAFFVFFSGPTLGALELAGTASVDYAANFLPRNLGLDPGIDRPWMHDWTSFYWANWYAWAPITALFLGRLGLGYTVRQFIRVNLVYTSLFGAFWMIAFGAIAIVTDGGSGPIVRAVTELGPEAAIYELLGRLPLAAYTPHFFVLLIFLSYVTAADSNVSAMSALCVNDIRPDQPEAPLFLKFLWGGIIGLTAWTLVAYAGIDGIRLISTLGGFPAMLLIILAGLGLLRLSFRSFSGREK